MSTIDNNFTEVLIWNFIAYTKNLSIMDPCLLRIGHGIGSSQMAKPITSNEMKKTAEDDAYLACFYPLYFEMDNTNSKVNTTNCSTMLWLCYSMS